MDIVKLEHTSKGWVWKSNAKSGGSLLCKSAFNNFFKVPKGTRVIDIVISKQKPKDCEEVYLVKYGELRHSFYIWDERYEKWLRLPIMNGAYFAFRRLLSSKWSLTGRFYLWVEA